jgi:hypothetical protein
MTKYATFGPDGLLTGRYDSEFNKTIPGGAVALTDELFFRTVTEQDGLWKLVDGAVVKTAFPPPSASVLIERAKTRINAAYEAAIAVLNADYPTSEIVSWPVQETEALAYLANSKAADTPWLKGAAKGRMVSVDNLALRVKRKADVYWPAHGEITGKRQRLRDAIDALGPSPTQAQLDAIQW